MTTVDKLHEALKKVENARAFLQPADVKAADREVWDVSQLVGRAAGAVERGEMAEALEAAGEFYRAVWALRDRWGATGSATVREALDRAETLAAEAVHEMRSSGAH